MKIDRTTLSDLSVLDPGEEGTCLFTLLDRTRSDLGRVALRARMRNLPGRSELRDTQDAIRHIAGRVADFQAAIEWTNPDAVDRYLSLKWQALTKRSMVGRVMERFILRWQYRDAVRQIIKGVESTNVFLMGVENAIDAIRGGPSLLELHAREMSQLIDTEALRELRALAGSRSLAGQLESDRRARGVARDSIRRLLAIVAELDALTACAVATLKHDWIFPEFVEQDGLVELRGLRHAQLDSGVPNDVSLETGVRVLALTGPNMAGKSTLLKAVGTAVYLAHLGCGVPASFARMSSFDALLALLYVRDNLSTGQSFYLGEVRRIKDLVTVLEETPRVFAIVDEPFKGTNVHDAAEATALLVDGLCAQRCSTVILSTHLASVVQSRVNDECLATVFLGAVETDAGLSFDYQLRSGISEQRLGMVLLAREGVAPALAAAIKRRSEGATIQ